MWQAGWVGNREIEASQRLILEYTNEGTKQRKIVCKKRSVELIRPNNARLTAAVEGPLK